MFQVRNDLFDNSGNDLLILNCLSGSSTADMKLYHCIDFPDPILYGHITDTMNGQLHILLYVLNNPDSPRFDVDKMPDGTKTMFGTKIRNTESEIAAMEYGLSPGQIRKGLRLLGPAILGFERFVKSLGQDLYFVEPLFYHVAYTFERYGFSYAKGKKLMERIQIGFAPDGDLLALLDASTPFRKPHFANSIRLRSWAIHDGILGQPFTDITMYKQVGINANVNTSVDCPW